jgi:hypothetical protein
LHKTIEKLNARFLDFTNDLVASGVLEQDPQVTKSLQRTIEHFITVVRASHVLTGDISTADDDGSGSATTESPIPEDSQDALSVNESTITISGTGKNSTSMMNQDLYTTFRGLHNTAAPELEMVDESVRNNAISEAPSGPTDIQSFPSKHLPPRNDIFNCEPQPPRPMNLCKLTFAQKLHMEAIRAGLRLVCTAEDGSQLFYQVFSRVLDFPTRESYRARLSRILDENFNECLLPPPESDLGKIWPGEESFVWLNASDVVSHFRSIGVDIDSSLDIVKGEINPECLPNKWADVQDLPAAELTTLCDDGFAEPQHRQLSHQMAWLSNTTYQHFTGAAQDANEFGNCAMDPTYKSRGHGKSFMSVNVHVSTLIHGEYYFPSCTKR